jgi:hypothetical protein
MEQLPGPEQYPHKLLLLNRIFVLFDAPQIHFFFDLLPEPLLRRGFPKPHIVCALQNDVIVDFLPHLHLPIQNHLYIFSETVVVVHLLKI